MAEQFLERAIASAELGDDRAARRWVERALAADPPPDLRAHILVHRAYHVGVSSSLQEGIRQLADVSRQDGLSDPVRARLETTRGLLLQRSASTHATDAFDEALRLLDRSDLHLRCSVHLNRGVAHMDARRLPAARSDFEQAGRLADEADDQLARAMASANLSYLLMLSGDLPAALRELDAVAPVLGEMSPVLAAKCLANRAEVLLAAGLLDEAAADLDRAVASFDVGHNAYEHADCEHQLARVRLALGEHGAARRLALSASRRFAGRGLAVRAARSRRLALQAQLAEADAPGAVARRAGELAGWFQEQELGREARLSRLLAAEAHVVRGDLVAAAAVAGDAAELGRHDPVVDRLRVRRLRAALADADGRPTDADRELRAAMGDLQRQVGLLGSLELRTAVAVHAQEIAVEAVGRAMAGGSARRVLGWAETTRALSSRLSPVTPSRDPVAAALLGELRQARSDTPSGPAGEPAVGLPRRVRDLEQALRRRAWQSPGRDESVRAVPLHRLTRALRAEDGVMLALLGHRGRVVALLLGDGPVRMRPLGALGEVTARARTLRADLDVLAGGGAPPAIRAVAHRSLASGLADLAERLLPVDLVPAADPRPLLLAPSAALSLVPWGLLPPLVGRTVTVSATGSSWLRGRTAAPTVRRTRVEVLSGPGLRHSRPELEAVASAWPEASVQPEAGALATLRAAGRADVLHVAAHGVHEPQSPLFSHLRMVDGPVFGHELFDLPRAPGHVVLSACEVGCAETRPGDERLGMAAALLAAGVGSVVAGVARVDDRTSGLVAAGHHRGLAAGLPPAQALAEALAGLPPEAGPAPFVCFGSGW